MKTILFATTFLLSGFGCSLPESDQLSSQAEDQIRNEVKAVADTIWAKWEQLDPEAALQYYWNSPEWMSINSQGVRYDLQAYRKLATDFKKSAAAYKWTTTRRDFKVVCRDIVICDWFGQDEAVWKSGDKITFNPHAYTLVFRKNSGQWKLVYSHDSGALVTQKAGKQ
jgi:hypothetical protein